MKSLLVQMDGTARCVTRLQIAAALAKCHDMRLTAMFAATPPLIDLPYSYAAETVTLGILHDLYVGWRKKALDSFEAAGLAPTAAWAELEPVPVVEGFAEQAMFADLMVLGQHDPQDPDCGLPPSFVPEVVIASGRPALVVPRVGHYASVGEHVVVAWKASPQSARALEAALPLMRGAKQVSVIEYGHAPQSCQGEALDLPSYLKLHGIQPVLHRYPDEPKEAGELLLSQCADLAADLLVMGCYGHSRAREFVLGGVTRTVLQSMTLPVLMCH